MSRKIIIPIIIAVIALILVFILYSNPLPKKESDKTFSNIIAETKTIDIIINAPYDSSSYEISKTINDKSEVEKITNILKEVNETEEDFTNSENNPDSFYYTLVLNTDNEKDNKHLYFVNDNLIINGKKASIESQKISEMTKYITDNISGYGLLKCEKPGTNPEVEKFFFKKDKIYHYSFSKTYTPKVIKEIDDYIAKINSYNGVSSLGNTIGEAKYSYIIDIDLNQVSEKDYKEITKDEKKNILAKTLEDIIKEKQNMKCNYSFLKEGN